MMLSIADRPARICHADSMVATATVAGWFGRLLLAPMDEAAIEMHRSEAMRRFMLDLGISLNQTAAAEALAVFFRDTPSSLTEAHMSHVFTLLFEGIPGPNAISLYESSYSGEGTSLYQTPFVEMQAILRELDITVSATCREPPDHLGLELAALAEALHQGNTDLTERLTIRLRGWVPTVAMRPDAQPYREIFALLNAFLSFLPQTTSLRDAQSASLL